MGILFTKITISLTSFSSGCYQKSSTSIKRRTRAFISSGYSSSIRLSSIKGLKSWCSIAYFNFSLVATISSNGLASGNFSSSGLTSSSSSKSKISSHIPNSSNSKRSIRILMYGRTFWLLICVLQR